MLVVGSYAAARRTAWFHPASGRLEPRRTPDGEAIGHRRGEYGPLGGTLVVLYRDGEALALRVGSSEVPMDGSVEISHQVVVDECVLTIGSLVELRYPTPPEWEGLENDMTPFVEAEHFDFGLFIARVARHPEQADRLYR
ncbi:hypothetical protein ACIQF6_20770 [Kitasatospora sp. NPDC092948]|uniref:hypothetical protein n=1 Tax=Kitasatospora sp. NPDC092948 TaxID=3364088 RepID=UPI0038080481